MNSIYFPFISVPSVFLGTNNIHILIMKRISHYENDSYPFSFIFFLFFGQKNKTRQHFELETFEIDICKCNLRNSLSTSKPLVILYIK